MRINKRYPQSIDEIDEILDREDASCATVSHRATSAESIESAQTEERSACHASAPKRREETRGRFPFDSMVREL